DKLTRTLAAMRATMNTQTANLLAGILRLFIFPSGFGNHQQSVAHNRATIQALFLSGLTQVSPKMVLKYKRVHSWQSTGAA
ncbi:MAG: hypothetical protein KDE47_17430, partial [Caldilineaceae bacterium]|nr:hypothetical protein [Caldilineaceae bacterium]